MQIFVLLLSFTACLSTSEFNMSTLENYNQNTTLSIEGALNF
jgi:hypothetical protein